MEQIGDPPEGRRWISYIPSPSSPRLCERVERILAIVPEGAERRRAAAEAARAQAWGAEHDGAGPVAAAGAGASGASGAVGGAAEVVEGVPEAVADPLMLINTPAAAADRVQSAPGVVALRLQLAGRALALVEKALSLLTAG